MSDEEDHDKDFLNENFCGCGTVKEAIDEAILRAVSSRPDGKCAMWEIFVVMMVEQLYANLISNTEIQRNGGDVQKGRDIAQATMNACYGEMSKAVEVGQDYIRERLKDAVRSGSGHIH